MPLAPAPAATATEGPATPAAHTEVGPPTTRPRPAPAPAPSRWWLVVVVGLLGVALAGPGVIVQRQPALHRGAGAGGGAGTVTMAGLAFKPDTLVVKRGATVVFRNDDQAPHTVTADSGAFDSGVLAPGATFSVTISGGLTYHCAIHAFMKARIYVAS